MSRLPIRPARHESAERRARINGSQITLWGSVASIGEMVLIKTYITVPSPYEDFRQTSNEVWQERLNGHELSVSLPRRRIDFSLQALPKEVVEYYSSDLSQMKICRTSNMKNCPDRVGEGVRFKRLEGDGLVYVRYPTNRYGYIRIPKIVASLHPDVVDYASGLMKVYRGDWVRAGQYFARVEESTDTKTQIRSDALLFRAMALSKLDLDGEGPAKAAFELNKIDANALGFLIMAKLSNASRGEPAAAQEKLEEILELAAEHELLLRGDAIWQAALATLQASN